jgi:hypothetical protein
MKMSIVMDHTKLLANLETLHDRICILEAGFGLGAKKPPNKSKEKMMAVKIAQEARGWIPNFNDLNRYHLFSSERISLQTKWKSAITSMLQDSPGLDLNELIAHVHNEFHEMRFYFHLNTHAGNSEYSYYLKNIKPAVIAAIRNAARD